MKKINYPLVSFLTSAALAGGCNNPQEHLDQNNSTGKRIVMNDISDITDRIVANSARCVPTSRNYSTANLNIEGSTNLGQLIVHAKQATSESQIMTTLQTMPTETTFEDFNRHRSQFSSLNFWTNSPSVTQPTNIFSRIHILNSLAHQTVVIAAGEPHSYIGVRNYGAPFFNQRLNSSFLPYPTTVIGASEQSLITHNAQESRQKLGLLYLNEEGRPLHRVFQTLPEGQFVYDCTGITFNTNNTELTTLETVICNIGDSNANTSLLFIVDPSTNTTTTFTLMDFLERNWNTDQDSYNYTGLSNHPAFGLTSSYEEENNNHQSRLITYMSDCYIEICTEGSTYDPETHSCRWPINNHIADIDNLEPDTGYDSIETDAVTDFDSAETDTSVESQDASPDILAVETVLNTELSSLPNTEQDGINLDQNNSNTEINNPSYSNPTNTIVTDTNESNNSNDAGCNVSTTQQYKNYLIGLIGLLAARRKKTKK